MEDSDEADADFKANVYIDKLSIKIKLIAFECLKWYSQVRTQSALKIKDSVGKII